MHATGFRRCRLQENVFSQKARPPRAIKTLSPDFFRTLGETGANLEARPNAFSAQAAIQIDLE